MALVRKIDGSDIRAQAFTAEVFTTAPYAYLQLSENLTPTDRHASYSQRAALCIGHFLRGRVLW
jgi:hypothetical protein